MIFGVVIVAILTKSAIRNAGYAIRKIDNRPSFPIDLAGDLNADSTTIDFTIAESAVDLAAQIPSNRRRKVSQRRFDGNKGYAKTEVETSVG